MSARRAFLGGIAGLGVGASLGLPGTAFASGANGPGARLVLACERGLIVIAVDLARAPVTAAHFMALADHGVFSRGASFYRSVAPDRDRNPVPIAVVQGGIGSAPSPLPPIVHESTAKTGLRHRDGTISMARGATGSASTEFFICVGDNPGLDHGGRRATDGEGFAAFGRVVAGMDIVREIHSAGRGQAGQGTAVEGQLLDPPIEIRSVRREALRH